MIKMMLQHILPLFVCFISAVCGLSLEDNFNTTVNPGCSTNCNKTWLIHGVVMTDDMKINHLWSPLFGPSFIIAATTKNSSLTIDWDKYQNGSKESLSFDQTPKNSFGISFQNVTIVYAVTVNGSEHNEQISMPTSLFNWTSNHTSHSFTFESTKFNGSVLPDNGKISLKVTVAGISGRSSENPQLQTRSQSAQIDVTFSNLESHILAINPNAKKLRYGIDMVVVSSDKPRLNSTFTYHNQESIDDEYTPGSFMLSSIETPSSGNDSSGGYLQWRPVSYLVEDRDVEHSVVPFVNVSLPMIDGVHLSASNRTLLYAFYGEKITSLLNTQLHLDFPLISHLNGVHFASNYSVWTFSMGLGKAPIFNISGYMKFILILFFGIPVVIFIVFFAIYYKRMRTQQSQYQTI